MILLKPVRELESKFPVVQGADEKPQCVRTLRAGGNSSYTNRNKERGCGTRAADN
jgi:hypothetical protein